MFGAIIGLLINLVEQLEVFLDCLELAGFELGEKFLFFLGIARHANLAGQGGLDICQRFLLEEFLRGVELFFAVEAALGFALFENFKALL